MEHTCAIDLMKAKVIRAIQNVNSFRTAESGFKLIALREIDESI
ncbi:MAG: hypothetical protein NXI04_23870 [Planctomycetaceae bacterium]|nr:hypothetical protein [Planctomycetaceae bacterium]